MFTVMMNLRRPKSSNVSKIKRRCMHESAYGLEAGFD